MDVRFTKTRKCLETIASRRSNTFKERKRPTNRQDVGGPRRRKEKTTKKQIRKNNPRSQEIHRGTRNTDSQYSENSPFPIVNSEKYSVVRRREFNQHLRDANLSESGVMHDYDTQSSVAIKPPVTTYGSDQFGAYIDLAGTEALDPLKVYTNVAANGVDNTTVGDIIYELPIAPLFLSNTRLKLLSKNYARWRPVNMRISYEPLGSSILSGGIVMTVLTDPGDTFTSTPDRVSRVRRALDYAGSKSFNVYNSQHIEFPRLPPDEEPFYIIPDGDARFEIPYTFDVIAQTTYAADPDDSTAIERTIGWLTLDYHIRLYDPILPDLQDNVTLSFGQFSSQLFTNVFINLTGVVLESPVVFNPAFPTEVLDNANIYQVVVVAQPEITAGTQIRIRYGGKIVLLSKGQVFYARNSSDAFINGISLYPTLEAATNGAEVFTFVDNIPIGSTFLKGLVEFRGFAFDA